MKVSRIKVSWIKVKPNEAKWSQVQSSETKRNRLKPSDAKWDQVKLSETMWDLPSPSEWSETPLPPPSRQSSSFSWLHGYFHVFMSDSKPNKANCEKGFLSFGIRLKICRRRSTEDLDGQRKTSVGDMSRGITNLANGVASRFESLLLPTARKIRGRHVEDLQKTSAEIMSWGTHGKQNHQFSL